MLDEIVCTFMTLYTTGWNTIKLIPNALSFWHDFVSFDKLQLRFIIGNWPKNQKLMAPLWACDVGNCQFDPVYDVQQFKLLRL